MMKMAFLCFLAPPVLPPAWRAHTHARSFSVINKLEPIGIRSIIIHLLGWLNFRAFLFCLRLPGHISHSCICTLCRIWLQPFLYHFFFLFSHSLYPPLIEGIENGFYWCRQLALHHWYLKHTVHKTEQQTNPFGKVALHFCSQSLRFLYIIVIWFVQCARRKWITFGNTEPHPFMCLPVMIIFDATAILLWYLFSLCLISVFGSIFKLKFFAKFPLAQKWSGLGMEIDSTVRARCEPASQPTNHHHGCSKFYWIYYRFLNYFLLTSGWHDDEL